MPTGYTYKVCDGTVTDFNTFALECARAFGACILQRDDAPGPPTMPKPCDWHANALAKAEAELRCASQATDDEMEALAGEAFDKQCESYVESRRRWSQEQDRIAAMEVAVLRWKPPTDEHVGLRDFMLEQLNISKSPTFWMQHPARMTVSEYRKSRIDTLTRDVKYHTDELKKEQERHVGRVRWITDLYTSLGLEPPKQPPHRTRLLDLARKGLAK